MIEITIPIIVSLAVVIVLSIIFKGKPKVDKGFKVNYFSLSYRRKMIRSLTTLPVIAVSLFVIYFLTDWSMFVNILFGLFFVLLYLCQIIYNFFMWRKEET